MNVNTFPVLILGMGGLGCPAALFLAQLGISPLTLVDPDQVELSNLPRQILFTDTDINAPKAERAAALLKQSFPNLTITPRLERPTNAHAIARLAQNHQVILDCTDNFPTRFAANDASQITGIPLVHGAATGLRGQVMTILPGQTACLRCLFGGPPETGGTTCREYGILSPLAGEVGALMALEAAKLATRQGQPLTNRMLTIDLARGARRVIPVPVNPRCTCQPHTRSAGS